MSTQTSFAPAGQSDGTLVTIFLRGGADGLNMVAPLEDAAYYRARPNLALAKSKALALDGFFGLNPLLGELMPAWKEGELAIVHGAGSEDQTRSHFEAQDMMEHGGLTGGGWLGRYLRARPDAANGALSCVAIGRALPESLAGAPTAAVLGKIEDFSFGAGSPSLRAELQKLYALEGDHLGAAAHDTFEALCADRRHARASIPAGERRGLRHRLLYPGSPADRAAHQGGGRSPSGVARSRRLGFAFRRADGARRPAPATRPRPRRLPPGSRRAHALDHALWS